MGIADSRGVVYDFSGPYQVTVGSFMCGPAKRTWRLDVNEIRTTKEASLSPRGKDQPLSSAELYDHAVIDASRTYGKRMHNLVFDNCHSHVATVLNLLEYEGYSNWNQIRVFWRIWMRGKWTSKRQALIVFAPLLVVIAVVAGLVAGLV
ncbi:transmembrane protein [Gracilaria domingensis]|nr:transmembrane protein [Gracilaria domingensis]